jgi:hypothetical protein
VSARISNPADRVLRARLKEPLWFPDLTERRTLKLSAISHYTGRAHFALWHRRVGAHDFREQTGVFTPLVHVDFEATDVPLDPSFPLVAVRGETSLAKTLDAAGDVDHLIREGRHTILARQSDGTETVIARAHLVNMFTRFDPDPARRRVVTLPEQWGLGPAPSRVAEVPGWETLIPAGRPPDFVETGTRVWHYGQTDPNRHVSGMEYLRMMECYVAEELHRHGHDLRRLYFSRARIVYRKPCFRGEGYRRVAWFRGEAPLVIAGAFQKANDPPDARPAVVVELTLSQHDGVE